MSKAKRPPLDRLERTIASRAANPNAKSYTSQLLDGGVVKIGAKIVEEATEVVKAAGEPGAAGREHFIYEVGDLIYHLMVLMRFRVCTLMDLETELARRFGVSGLAEKAGRKTAVPKVTKATRTRAPRKKSGAKGNTKAKPKSKAMPKKKAKR
jgi:phosphoribosyl-ATP pyrophosphohydrolase